MEDGLEEFKQLFVNDRTKIDYQSHYQEGQTIWWK